MKLKLVVASMSVLGLIATSSAFADTQTKHKHHKKHHHHHVMAAPETETYNKSEHDFKGEAVLPAQQVMIEACPRTDMYTQLMTRMDQNVGRAVTTVGCDNPISFAGGINFDTMWGNRDTGFQGVNTRRIDLNDAYLNVFGNVNEFTTAFMSMSYSNFTDTGLVADPATFNVRGQRNGIYSAAYSSNTLTVEQGFITVRDWNASPFFLQIGKQYQPFGRYVIHPMTRTMDQVLSESLQTSAEVGFIVPMGFHGAVYTFDNPSAFKSLGGVTRGHTQLNYGAELGYDQTTEQLGFDLGLGYMYNMTGVEDVAYGVNQFNGSSTTAFGGNYTNRVSAGSLYADAYSGPFSVGIRYVSALQHFSLSDLSNQAKLIVPSTSGAKPWAAGITGGYGFNIWNKNQNIYLGYQASGDSVNLFLPKSRWVAGYGIDVFKNTNLGLEYNHDIDYSTGVGATGNTSNRVNLRVGVKFG